MTFTFQLAGRSAPPYYLVRLNGNTLGLLEEVPGGYKACVPRGGRTVMQSKEAAADVIVHYLLRHKYGREKLEKAGYQAQPERIKEAAIRDRVTNIVYTGENHAAIANRPYMPRYRFKQVLRSLLFGKFGEQGFVTEGGRFVDRAEAAQIALACGQIEKLRYLDGELDSADLNYHSVPQGATS